MSSNPGQIYTDLVYRELGNSCPKCGNSDMSILQNKGIESCVDGTIESCVEFWERYINEPALIKKELHMYCNKC